MRTFVFGMLLAAPLLLLAPSASQAWGHGGHGHFHSHPGFFVGISPFGWGFAPWWWGPPPAFGYGYDWGYGYWGPAGVIQAPPVYPYGGEAAPNAYWYYCPSAGDYYPRVATCPDPWLRVVPVPR